MPKRKSDKHAAATIDPELTLPANAAELIAMAGTSPASSTLPNAETKSVEPPATKTRHKATSRREALRDELSKVDGASITELCDTFGWQPHSARAAISGLRKDGANVERFLAGEGETGPRYRIASAASA